MNTTHEASSPVPWPPIIYGVAALTAALLSWLAGWSFEAPEYRTIILWMGKGVCALAVAIGAMAGSRFGRAGTPIPPNRPTTALVVDGVFTWTRNPMYLGFSLLLLGLGLVFDQLWFIIAVPLAMLAVTKLAIEREEAYLERKFGAEYGAYKARVRRWI